MKVVEIRSPFIIQVNEPTQLGSKIEVFIWRNGDTEPTTPTYTLSKPIPTTNQRQQQLANEQPRLITSDTDDDSDYDCRLRFR